MARSQIILYEIFVGEGGQVAQGKSLNEYVSAAFNTMRFIVAVGWSIYPLDYLFGYVLGTVDDNILNLTYNLADMLNKIWFVAASTCWATSSVTFLTLQSTTSLF